MESTGVPSEREGMGTFPPSLPRAQSCRVSRWETSRELGKSFDVSREGMDLRRMSADASEVETDVQRRDGGLDVSMFEESMGEPQEGAQTQDSRISGLGGIDPSTLSTAATRSKKWGRTLRGKKSKFWKRLKSSMGLGGGSSSGSDTTGCMKCGRPHKGVCRYGTNLCYKCGQKGHMVRECPIAPW